jgi:hypothetical protein|tara:strand:- start:2434 stop:2886 length:453 start_codon:yes stop_codon:yes gene_type:complete
MRLFEIIDPNTQYFEYLNSLDPKEHKFIKVKSADLLRQRFQQLSELEAIRIASKWILTLAPSGIPVSEDISRFSLSQYGQVAASVFNKAKPENRLEMLARYYRGNPPRGADAKIVNAEISTIKVTTQRGSKEEEEAVENLIIEIEMINES